MTDSIGHIDETIAKVFYDSKTGFGSVEDTYQRAHAINPAITRAWVRGWMTKQEIRQHKRPAKNQVNSFVADFPRQEFQVDLLDMGRGMVPRYGFVCIDIFTKKAFCIPLRHKTPGNTTQALKMVFEELGYPSSILCDSGTEFKGAFAELCKEEMVDIITPITGARFAERFIRTLKNHLIQRTRALGGRWSQYVEDVIDKYNDTKHSSTGEKPNQVADFEYDFDFVKRARESMMEHAKFPVKHPPLAVGDRVKMRIKPSKFYKETFISWSKQVYTIERIDAESPHGKMYYLQGHSKPLLRFELKKITDVQHFEGGELKSKLFPVASPAPEPDPEPIPPSPPAPRFKRLKPVKPENVYTAPEDEQDYRPKLRKSRRVIPD